ncbi:hypothetical protein TIFTF001_021767 [Ficus carica]|uniref:EF-hand domain-containing protein n=1 Tax=Ficus carica TaxID=3494 RepID=A0AA88DB22_FICCA|nr:hypothetical protein TIFTF001_021767 [Ficus carica]
MKLSFCCSSSLCLNIAYSSLHLSPLKIIVLMAMIWVGGEKSILMHQMQMEMLSAPSRQQEPKVTSLAMQGGNPLAVGSFKFSLCAHFIQERDTDKDGKVNFKEFFHGLFDLVRNYDDESHNFSHHSDDSMEAPAKVLFSQLDTDGDGSLSDEELLPVIGKLHPSEHYYAKQQSDYIISQADTDKDGRLTLAEMIDNPYVFYSAIFNDDEEDYEYHDEFR